MLYTLRFEKYNSARASPHAVGLRGTGDNDIHPTLLLPPLLIYSESTTEISKLYGNIQSGASDISWVSYPYRKNWN